MSRVPEDVHLFVLAHPDDEIAFAPLLSRLVGERKTVRLVYLTDGAALGASAATRQAESLAALEHLGIPPSSALFAGSDIAIPDGELHRHLERAIRAIEDWSRPWRSIADVYSLAWEGGHPDHDAALVIAAAFASQRSLADHLWQVPFYRASDRLPPPLFSVASPLAANGPVTSIALTSKERRLPVDLLRFYPSQWRSFVGLGPFILARAFTNRGFDLQRLDPERLFERPTARPLLYEHRNGVRFDEFRAVAEPFLKRRLASRAPPRVRMAETA